MSNRDFFSQLGQQLGGLLGQNDLPGDVERKVRAMVQSGLARMDVVTREEFDAQAAVLARTRTRLEELERRVEEFARELDSTDASSLPSNDGTA